MSEEWFVWAVPHAAADLVLLLTMTDKLVDMLMEIVYEWVVFILTSN